MRLWSLHPSYLDTAGLTACWREGLLARKVLQGNTAGYRNHPQLERFRKCDDPLTAIDSYLWEICDEADRRGYNFDRNKINKPLLPVKLNVTSGQIDHEFRHLKEKLRLRSPEKYRALCAVENVEKHPVFTEVEGDTESWEKVK